MYTQQLYPIIDYMRIHIIMIHNRLYDLEIYVLKIDIILFESTIPQIDDSINQATTKKTIEPGRNQSGRLGIKGVTVSFNPLF